MLRSAPTRVLRFCPGTNLTLIALAAFALLQTWGRAAVGIDVVLWSKRW